MFQREYSVPFTLFLFSFIRISIFELSNNITAFYCNKNFLNMSIDFFLYVQQSSYLYLFYISKALKVVIAKKINEKLLQDEVSKKAVHTIQKRNFVKKVI